LDVPIIKSADC